MISAVTRFMITPKIDFDGLTIGNNYTVLLISEYQDTIHFGIKGDNGDFIEIRQRDIKVTIIDDKN